MSHFREAHRFERAFAVDAVDDGQARADFILRDGKHALLLDEPFEGVAPALAHRLVEVVVDLKREGMSVLVSESDLQHSERMVDQIIVIDRGAITSVQ